MTRCSKSEALTLLALALLLSPATSFGQPDSPSAPSPLAQARTFSSAAMKVELEYHIYVPPAYEAATEQRFPVVYWLHGGSGFPPGVLATLAGRFDAAIRAGKVPPLIVVFPDGLGESMWVDSKDGTLPMERIVVSELVPHIDGGFRTIASAPGRILEGGSMGGYGAARLAFKYPEMFGALSMLNAGPLQEVLDPQNVPLRGTAGAQATLDRVYGGDQEYFRSQSPIFLAEQNADAVRGKVVIRQLIGEQDPSLENNRRFSEHLEKLMIPHTFEVLEGVQHGPRSMFAALGESYWEFFREFLEGSDGVSSEAKADPADAERNALIALERESHRWWHERNTEALAGLFAEDYRFVAPNGAVEDKAFVLAGTDPAVVRMLQVESMRMDPEEVILSGNRAIVLGVIEMKATVAGRPADGRLRVLSVFERSDADAEWRLVARSTTPVRTPPAAPN